MRFKIASSHQVEVTLINPVRDISLLRVKACDKLIGGPNMTGTAVVPREEDKEEDQKIHLLFKVSH